MDRRGFMRGAGVGVAATLAILVWHFYTVIFRPGVYPMNRVWLSGKLTGTQMAEEHPEELEELLAGQPSGAPDPRVEEAGADSGGETGPGPPAGHAPGGGRADMP